MGENISKLHLNIHTAKSYDFHYENQGVDNNQQNKKEKRKRESIKCDMDYLCETHLHLATVIDFRMD